MECREIKELISAWADGEVSPEEARLLEGHFAQCPSCRRLARRMRALDEGITGMTFEVLPGFRKELLARMEREELLPRRRSTGLSLRWAAVPLAAAAALALLVLSAREAGKPPLPPAAGPRVAERAPGAVEGAARKGAPSDIGAAGEPAPGGVPERAGTAVARAPGAEGDLSREDREIIAYLEVLEDPQALDDENDLDDWYPPGSGRERG